ncbi:hypothetical protein HMPREF9554_01923 [Treponema phagedenis F0421]|nr:hypothetical protein HMPREF9554_01923 [Treponema phagedenis F0421]
MPVYNKAQAKHHLEFSKGDPWNFYLWFAYASMYSYGYVFIYLRKTIVTLMK